MECSQRTEILLAGKSETPGHLVAHNQPRNCLFRLRKLAPRDRTRTV